MTPELGLEMGKRAKAFRAIEAILRADPVLSRVVKTWAAWTGDPEDADGMEPVRAMMPMIRLSPLIAPNQPTTVQQKTATVVVRVEPFVAGLDADDLLNLWDAIEGAIGYARPFRGMTVDCWLNKEVGSYNLESTLPGFNAWEGQSEPTKYLSGNGRIAIAFLQNRA